MAEQQSENVSRERTLLLTQRQNIVYVVLAAAIAMPFIAMQLYAPTPTQYEYHMSYNEWWYTQVRSETIRDDLIPPGYTVLSKLFAFENHVVALRLTSLFATALLIAVISHHYGPTKAAIVATLPWTIMWSIRAQPDSLMTSFCISGLVLLMGEKRHAHFLGGLLVGLSAFVKPVGLLAVVPAMFSNGRKDFLTWVGLTVGALPFVAWATKVPVTTWVYHASKSVPFENLLANGVFLIVGLGVFWYAMVAGRLVSNVWFGAGVTFILFAYLKAPYAHEYYLLPGLMVIPLAFTVPKRWDLVVCFNVGLGVLLVVANGPFMV